MCTLRDIHMQMHEGPNFYVYECDENGLPVVLIHHADLSDEHILSGPEFLRYFRGSINAAKLTFVPYYCSNCDYEGHFYQDIVEHVRATCNHYRVDELPDGGEACQDCGIVDINLRH